MPEPLSAAGRYSLFRARIDHEDDLIVQRLSWLVASQSFLFTAYAIVLNGLASPTGGPVLGQQQRLLHLIPLVGCATAGLIYVTILAAVVAIRRLRRGYATLAANEPLPEIQTRAAIRLCGLTAPLVLPLVYLAVWIVLWAQD